MSKKLMSKMGTGVTSAPMPLGASTVIAIAAGIAAVVGVSTLHKRRVGAQQNETDRENGALTANGASNARVRVGLLRLHVPQNWRDLVKNDVLLEKTVNEVADVLIIYVVGQNKHEIVNYTGELYNMAWDTACLKNKPLLDIRIVCGLPDEAFPAWEELILLPELNAVFGEEEMVNVQHMNAKRFEQDGLFAVTYHPLAMYVARYFNDGLYRYFEDENTHMRPQDSVLLGGTFDHLHNGHKKLLSLAVSICKRQLIIGITSEEMLKSKKNADLIESLEKRKQSVLAYVAFLKPGLQVEFSVLSDPFGPAIEVPGPAALVVSTETVPAVGKIESIRAERGLRPLEIYVCRRTDAYTLSSSYIRERLAASKRSKP
ncbi:hypothetical protein Poli38472_000326 [Pythium oligandrum]|uniref:Cytidyltransferase-like domain-containing protein n=1 Tax=Pythium oligandrum TaxID=41045 RepID=A0A8K1FGR3_PYTOL|nr:hypothetical protein Poli38472_000326 [Pythium oligandrum]|eukprot:TMW60284.1 hypothetical protein Poli38472_000326 [Pythium oligandrum]